MFFHMFNKTQRHTYFFFFFVVVPYVHTFINLEFYCVMFFSFLSSIPFFAYHLQRKFTHVRRHSSVFSWEPYSDQMHHISLRDGAVTFGIRLSCLNKRPYKKNQINANKHILFNIIKYVLFVGFVWLMFFLAFILFFITLRF